MSFRQILEEYDFIENKDHFWELLLSERPTYFRVNTIKTDKEQIVKALQRYKDLEFEPVDFLDNYYVVKKGNISKKPEHLFGYLYIQDISSALIVHSFSKKSEVELILDICASPGGKTTLLSTLFPNSLIIANDIGRINSLIHNIQRIGALNVIVTRCDAKLFPLIENKEIDLILADVPCSSESNLDNYQTYNVNKHRKFVNYITKNQYEILKRVTEISSEKTEILYSTCTFNPLENEYIVDKIIKEKKAKAGIINTLPSLENIKHGLTNYKGIEFDKSLANSLRFYPQNMGGMFVSKLIPLSTHKNIKGSTAKIVSIQDQPTFQNYQLKQIDPSIAQTYLQHFGIKPEIINKFIWFVKDKEKISDIYVSSTNLFLTKQKGPMIVEYFGLKALRYFKPLNTYKPTSSFLSILNSHIKKNFVELKFDIDLLRRFLMREEMDFKCFDVIEIENSSPFVAVKFNGLVIGCAIVKGNKIVSEIPTSKADFLLNVF
ncbi:MAG: RsmB/NOP family class I SAM-dependent RNA methyltransferase [bacterium]|nr:RsmB/NOP family class I SAM-dependent RNA methyltransferase [bacterium]